MRAVSCSRSLERCAAAFCAAVVAVSLAACGRDGAESEAASTAGAGAASASAGAGGRAEDSRQLRYDVEYPVIGYSTVAPTEAVAQLAERIGQGETTLERHPQRGYLEALLAALDIGIESQVLVFSRTSLQVQDITAATPRAIYFNDDTYVAWVPGAPNIEIASLDPNLGPVFHTLSQDPAAPVALQRRSGECLRCHDSYSLTGGGVPRFITGSGYIDTQGRLVAHEGWILTSDRTPLRSRWGGWYVSGFHGEQVHLGNIAVRDVEELQRLEALRTGNVEDLGSLLDTSRYLTDFSDIVALLVLEHQVSVQNAITRASYDARMALSGRGEPSATLDARGAPSGGSEAIVDLDVRIAEIAEPLVEALFLVGEAPLTDRIEGTSGFAEAFEARGPHDAAGRSLRDLDLTQRLFEHPLSYVIYSEAFAALPSALKARIYTRIGEILRGDDASGTYAHLTAEDRAAIGEILRATAPELASATAAEVRERLQPRSAEHRG